MSRLVALACLLCSAALCDAQLTAQDKIDALKEHNAWRAEVGAPPLEWDDNLAAVAQEWSDNMKNTNNCGLTHRAYPADRSTFMVDTWGANVRLGENMATESGGSIPSRTAVAVTNQWTKEKDDWNFGPSSECQQDGMVGHYTQIVWADSQYMGCGKALCPDATYGWKDIWTCNFYPAGNFIGKYPYCSQNNPANVGTCTGYVNDPTKEPSAACLTPSTTCDATGVQRCSSEDPCSVSVTWPEIDALEDGGRKVFTGGLGQAMDADQESWMCWEDSSCAAGDLACFKYHERDERFVWYGFNSVLRIVPESEYVV